MGIIKVMSFNIRADNVLDINNRWRTRANIVYDVINKYDCDVIGLQEVTEKMYVDLYNHIDGYEMIGLGRTRRFFSEKNSLFIKKEHIIKENETFWLSKDPKRNGSSIWYSLFPRICTTAIVELKGGLKVRIYNTHLDCLLPHAREYGLKTIIRMIDNYHEKDNLPCILMGDFNATPNSRLIRQLKEGYYSQHRFVAVQDVCEEAYSKATMGMFKGKEKGLHIDYIFVSEHFEIKHVEIVKYNKNGKYPSDHYPILAELSI